MKGCLINRIMFATVLLCAAANSNAADAALPEGVSHVQMKVGDADREAYVYAPKTATATDTPLVFVFHGHGGSAKQVARSMPINRLWPEAISVYMQGLDTPGKLTDPDGKKSGWQAGAGAQDDRDLKFFDAMLEKVKHDYKVDPKRIYSTGHSNGGGFTYLLWETRADVFAAFAPSSAPARNAPKFVPKPVMHIAGEHDPLVKFEWQKVTMDAVKKVNGCDEEGKAWDTNCTIYASKTGTPLVTFIHSGGHEFNSAAPPLIVKFFKEHPAVEK